jgi:hypothetical protein
MCSRDKAPLETTWTVFSASLLLHDTAFLGVAAEMSSGLPSIAGGCLTAMPAFRRRDGSNKLTAYLHISSGMHRTVRGLGNSSHRETPISPLHDGVASDRIWRKPAFEPVSDGCSVHPPTEMVHWQTVSRLGGDEEVSSSRDRTLGDQE